VRTLITERLYLREFTIDDITPLYLDSLNSKEITGLTEARHKNWNLENTVEYIKNSNIEGVSKLIGIFLRQDNRPIGNIRLFNFHPVHKRAELGILIYDKACWGKSYGTEALKAVNDYAFRELNLHRIVADYYSVNIGSAKIFQKAGYTIEGVFKDHFWLDGKFIDSIRVGIINNSIYADK
jgi:[ribosomal protein S5]-alanine N-acetyltransferase